MLFPEVRMEANRNNNNPAMKTQISHSSPLLKGGRALQQTARSLTSSASIGCDGKHSYIPFSNIMFSIVCRKLIENSYSLYTLVPLIILNDC